MLDSSGCVTSSVRPLYHILSVIGLAPFGLSDAVNKATWKRIWSCILASLLLSMLIFRFARLLLWETHLAESSVQWVPTALHLLFTYSTTITALFMAASVKYRNGVQLIFITAKSLDEELQHHDGDSPWKTIINIIIISAILLPISVVTIILWQDLWPPVLTLCDIYCFLTNTLLVMQFVNSVLIFRSRSLAFNNYILSQPWKKDPQSAFNNRKVTSTEQSVSKLSCHKSCTTFWRQKAEAKQCKSSACMRVAYTVKCESPVKMSCYNSDDVECTSFSPSTGIHNSSSMEHITFQIQKLRSIHLSLYDLSHLINETFGFQILFSLASFFNFVLLSLNFTVDLVGRVMGSIGSNSNGYYVSMNQEGITIFWGLWAAACIITITVNCHHAAMDADNLLIAMHRATLVEMKQETKVKLDSLLLQLVTTKIKFVAAGFFVIDLSLLHAIVAVMCTYLIVIFQFRS